jgi:hypothetical protein
MCCCFCRHCAGSGEPVLTRWEVEFYSYIASQHRKSTQPKTDPSDAEETKSSNGTMSDATAESSGPEDSNRKASGAGVDDKSRKGSAGLVVTVQSGRSKSFRSSRRSEASSVGTASAANGDGVSTGVHGTVHAHTAATGGDSSGDEGTVGFDASSDGYEDVSEPSDMSQRSASRQHSATSRVSSNHTGHTGTHPHSASSRRSSSVRVGQSADGESDGDVVYSLESSRDEVERLSRQPSVHVGGALDSNLVQSEIQEAENGSGSEGSEDESGDSGDEESVDFSLPSDLST